MTPTNIRTILSQCGAEGYAVANKTAASNGKHSARKASDDNLAARDVYRKTSLRIGKASAIELARAANRSPSSLYAFIRHNPDFFHSEITLNRYGKNVMFYWVDDTKEHIDDKQSQSRSGLHTSVGKRIPAVTP